MTSRQRILAALSGQPADHTPLTTWCFGLSPPPMSEAAHATTEGLRRLRRNRGFSSFTNSEG